MFSATVARSGRMGADMATPLPPVRLAPFATGACLPGAVLTSFDLEARLGLPSGWIERRTGVRRRHLAAPGEATSDLAAAAARQALAAAALPPEELDLLILCTSTPDHPMPPSAPLVLARLGARRAAGFDLAAACSGFIYGLFVADAVLRAGRGRHVLLVGANVMSRRVNWDDPDTAALFGDGAGALLLSAAPGPPPAGDGACRYHARGTPPPPGEDAPGREDGAAPRGLLSVRLAAEGEAADLFLVPAGGSREPLTPEGLAARRDRMVMRGGPLARRAVRAMAELLLLALADAGLAAGDLDWLVPHQANLRLIETVARQLGFPLEKVMVNVDRCGNTSAASIPIALHEAASNGRLRPGELVGLVAFGGGLTAAAAVLRW